MNINNIYIIQYNIFEYSLYSKARFLGYKRSKHNQRLHTR